MEKAIEFLKIKENHFLTVAVSGAVSTEDAKRFRSVADTLCEVRWALTKVDLHDSQAFQDVLSRIDALEEDKFADQEAYVQGRIREAGFLDAEAYDLLVRAYRLLDREDWARQWVDDYLDYQHRMMGVYGDKQNG